MSREEDRINAGRAVVIRFLEDEIREAKTTMRNVLEPRMAPGERIPAQLPDGTAIGAVGLSKPRKTPTVTDEKALLEWVKTNRPDEIVESVNPAYIANLKAQVRSHGYAFDRETGEIIPGVEMEIGSPSYSPAPDKDQVPLLRRRLAEIVAGGLLALSPAETDRSA